MLFLATFSSFIFQTFFCSKVVEIYKFLFDLPKCMKVPTTKLFFTFFVVVSRKTQPKPKFI